MNYATEQEMIDLFGEGEIIELTNLDNPSATTVDSTKLDAALEYASREVDSYLQAAQYKLPLASTPLVLRNKVADIARYHLDIYQAREDARKRYEDVLKWLKMLAEGKVSLGIDNETQEVISSGGADYYTENRVFTFSGLDHYVGRT